MFTFNEIQKLSKEVREQLLKQIQECIAQNAEDGSEALLSQLNTDVRMLGQSLGKKTAIGGYGSTDASQADLSKLEEHERREVCLTYVDIISTALEGNSNKKDHEILQNLEKELNDMVPKKVAKQDKKGLGL